MSLLDTLIADGKIKCQKCQAPMQKGRPGEDQYGPYTSLVCLACEEKKKKNEARRNY